MLQADSEKLHQQPKKNNGDIILHSSRPWHSWTRSTQYISQSLKWLQSPEFLSSSEKINNQPVELILLDSFLIKKGASSPTLNANCSHLSQSSTKRYNSFSWKTSICFDELEIGKCPFVLNAKNTITRLYLVHVHRVCIYQGTEPVKAFFQQRYHFGLRKCLLSINFCCFFTEKLMA